MRCQLSSIRTLVVIAAFSVAWPTLVSAQTQGGTGNQGGDTGNQGGTGTGATGNNQAGAGANAGLNADEAFSGVERGSAIGATTATGSGFSTAGAAGGGGLGGGLGGGGGFGGGLGGLFGGQGFGGQAQNAQPVIRTRLRSAIEGSRPMPQVIQQNLSNQMQTIPRRAGISGVSVSVNGTTAIVTGVVSTDKQRRMTELLLRLEPGVRHVDNRVTVAP